MVDENTASIAYRSGAVMDAKWVEDVPIIDLRAYNESAEIHTSGNSTKLRARLDRTNGHHGNQIVWTWNNGVPIVGVGPPQEIELKSFLLLDRWLARIEADTREIPKAQKVVLDKPLDAVDACFAGTFGPAAPGTPSPPSSNQEITDPGQCNSLYPFYSLTRPAAGAPATDDVIQCALSPINPEDYLPATLSDAQLAALRKTFPNGVCDYTKPGRGPAALDPVDDLRGRPGRQAAGSRAAVGPVRPEGGAGRRSAHVPQQAQGEAAHPRQEGHPRALDRDLRRRPQGQDPARRPQVRVVELPRSQAREGARAGEDPGRAQGPSGDAALSPHLPALCQEEAGARQDAGLLSRISKLEHQLLYVPRRDAERHGDTRSAAQA